MANKEMEKRVREWSYLEDLDTETVANTILEWRDGYRCEQIEVPEDIERWAVLHSDGYDDKARDIARNVETLKSRLRGTRCLNKLLDAIGETIYWHADSCAEDFGVSQEILQIALEEMVYNTTYTGECLNEIQSDEE